MADNHDDNAFTTKTSYTTDSVDSWPQKPAQLADDQNVAEQQGVAEQIDPTAPVDRHAELDIPERSNEPFINNLEAQNPQPSDDDLIFGQQDDLSERYFGDDLVVGEGLQDISGSTFGDGVILGEAYETLLAGDGNDLITGGNGIDALEVHGTDWNVHINGVGDMSMNDFLNSEYSDGQHTMSGYMWDGGMDTPPEDPEATLINFNGIEEINFVDFDSGT